MTKRIITVQQAESLMAQLNRVTKKLDTELAHTSGHVSPETARDACREITFIAKTIKNYSRAASQKPAPPAPN